MVSICTMVSTSRVASLCRMVSTFWNGHYISLVSTCRTVPLDCLWKCQQEYHVRKWRQRNAYMYNNKARKNDMLLSSWRIGVLSMCLQLQNTCTCMLKIVTIEAVPFKSESKKIFFTYLQNACYLLFSM